MTQIRKSGALLEASREVGLEVNKEKGKCKYMVVSRHQNVGQNLNLLIADKSFENVTRRTARYLGSLKKF
jgi:hypothetical protein